MIPPMKFDGMLKDLELYFESSYNSTQKEKLYEIYKHIEAWVMDGAIMWLMETFKPYPGHRLPIGTDISDAIKEASRGDIRARPEELDDGFCEKCNGIGGVISPVLHLGIEYDGFYPCDCRKGKIYEKAFGALKEKRGFLRKGRKT